METSYLFAVNTMYGSRRPLFITAVLLRSAERKLFNPSIPVYNQTNKKYARICKRNQIQFKSLN